jgi:hypothetical protein
MTDEQLREALAPLGAEEPSEAEVAAVVAAAGSAPARRPTRRRRLWRAAAGVAVATACAAVALAVQGPTSRPGSAPSMLLAAAAVAAEQPQAAGAGAYRYVEWLDRFSIPDGETPPTIGAVSTEQRVETWVDEHYKGRRVQHQGRVLSGDPKAVQGTPFYGPSDAPYVLLGPRTRLDGLPTEPTALRDVLVTEYRTRTNWAPGLPTEAQTHYDMVRKVLYLLGQASDPKLRATLFELLAITPGVERADGAEDPLGRSGRAVRIPTRPDGGGGTFTVVFDPETSELLSWSEVGTGGGTPDQSHTILHAGQVAAVGDRPER